MDYNTYLTTMQTMLVIYDATGQQRLLDILPDMINYAELRIYRDLQLLNTVTSASAALTVGSRNLAIPQPTGGTFVVIESANVITPSSVTDPDLGARSALQRISKEYANYIYGNATTGQPVCYADIDNETAILLPPPDATYTVEFYGTMRPTPLSVSNVTTILTEFFPDLFVAASMVFGAGYQRDFGAQSEDPQLGTSWEAQYGALKSGANVEELMKKSASQGWSAFQPTPANPPRS